VQITETAFATQAQFPWSYYVTSDNSKHYCRWQCTWQYYQLKLQNI